MAGNSRRAMVESLSAYVRGMADAFALKSREDASARLRSAADWLEKLAVNMCGAGFIGCRGGPGCTSDHK